MTQKTPAAEPVKSDTPAVKVTAPAPDALAFEEVDVPKVVRPAKKNEYTAVAEKIVAADGKALAFSLPAAQHAPVLRLIRNAAPDHTIRSKADGDRLTVWATDRITRKRNKSTDTAPASVPNAEADAPAAE